MGYIAIINGPNLNRLGLRDRNLYGDKTLEDINKELAQTFGNASLNFFQSNSEGDIIDKIQNLSDDRECVAIVINPGAYAHYSYAIADALRDVPNRIMTIEVHISNILQREDFRRKSVTAEAVNSGVISGCGVNGYALAITHVLHYAAECPDKTRQS